ncbi:MAG: hypothetical protein Q8L22_27565 [Reyranella sp.]|nr:hypothetical protein [Reyranella sp.]
MNRRALLFTAVAASTIPAAASAAPNLAASDLTVIYVGGRDCPPCIQWKNTQKAGWLASPEFHKVTWIEVDARKLKEAYQKRYWPGELKPILDQIPRKGGTPRFLIVKDGRIVSNEFGGNRWVATMDDLRKLLG